MSIYVCVHTCVCSCVYVHTLMCMCVCVHVCHVWRSEDNSVASFLLSSPGIELYLLRGLMGPNTVILIEKTKQNNTNNKKTESGRAVHT